MHRWLSRRALLLHLEFFLIVAGCAVATWWQATRALGGNGLSWFYTFEWPILAGIAIAAWWHLIHENPEERAAERRRELGPGRARGRVVKAAVGAGCSRVVRCGDQANAERSGWLA